MYVIKNGTIHTGTGEVLENYDILIEGKKIKKIEKNICEADAEIIDATGKQVFPGFIDPHSSIGAMGIPTRYRDNAETTNVINPDLSVKYAIDPDEVNAQEFYKSGITSVGFSPDHSNVIGGQITVCKTAPDHMANRIVKEHAAMKGSVCSTVKDVYGASNQMPKTRMGIFHLLKEAIRKDDLLKKYQMPFVIAAETAGEIQCLMELLKDEDIQLTIVDGFEFGDAIEELKEKKVGIIFGNFSNLSQISKHEIDLSRLKELVENGNRIAFTNTCKGASEGREVFIWSAIEVYRAGIDAEDVVKMMTIQPAEMLGVADQIGSIEVGKGGIIVIQTLIKNGILYTMTEDKGIFQGDILVEGTKIKEVAEHISEDCLEDGDKLIEAEGYYVLPGLIDAHSHIGLFDFNVDPGVDDANEMTNPVTLSVDARFGTNPKAREFKVAYEHGITTMLLTPGSGNVFCGLPFALKTYGNNVFDMTIKSPCAVKIALGGNPKNTYGDQRRLPMTRMGIAKVLDDTFAKAKKYMEDKEQNKEVEYDPDMEALCLALK